MTFHEELTAKTEGVEEIIRKYLPLEEGLQKTVFSASDYSVLNGGKRLRPLLMQETYTLFDGRGKGIEPFMAAIEYIHSSSLVHDDLPCMDNDEYRRGKKSTWAAFGEDMGVLAGDALLVYAFETASKALLQCNNPANVVKAMEVLANKAGIYGMIGGQTVDVELTGKALNEEQLQFIYNLKTGALIEASMMIGAIMADASAEDIRSAEAIASKVGVAFQIQDDILDVTSTTEVLGKPVGSDEKNNKTTYVTLYGLEEAKNKVASLTEEALELLSSLTGENLFLEKLIRYLITREN
ncbi:MAG: polyprenyl synthetase family protein [Lachnospiraceae bacterium]|nr:polyprenyl synthetase family protein [Lachnospiraceae bacterium]